MAHQIEPEKVFVRRMFPPLTQERMEQFLELYAKTGVINKTAELLAIGVSQIKDARQRDKEFAAAFDEATERYVDSLKEEAHRRAVEGIDRPIVGRVGKDEDGVITYERVYSDKLLVELLRSKSTDFRQSNIPPAVAAVAAQGGVLVLPVRAPMSPGEWEKQFSDLAQGTTYMPDDMRQEEQNGRSTTD